ncbi:hypothetical protein TL16_g12397 [Triparma laevis f. inornata]|uniref:Uncharacterized protein n=1 Tax=Triparma laevis f. inornata TaxID=1714386 RepID=A0A9W7BKZ5_9STRA|nr:hypothetical protein TL16_g12397 [Triparma laevis f. inornata]
MASAIIPYFSLLLPESAGIAPELPQMISDYAIFLTELGKRCCCVAFLRVIENVLDDDISKIEIRDLNTATPNCK